jgi:hypothetical protein
MARQRTAVDVVWSDLSDRIAFAAILPEAPALIAVNTLQTVEFSKVATGRTLVTAVYAVNEDTGIISSINVEYGEEENKLTLATGSTENELTERQVVIVQHTEGSVSARFIFPSDESRNITISVQEPEGGPAADKPFPISIEVGGQVLRGDVIPNSDQVPPTLSQAQEIAASRAGAGELDAELVRPLAWQLIETGPG